MLYDRQRFFSTNSTNVQVEQRLWDFSMGMHTYEQ